MEPGPRVQLDRDIFGNLLSRREASGVRRYCPHDGLGGLTGITDEAGTHVASLFYDAWGNTRATGGTWTAGNYRFTGAELDSATGLYHMGARFYDPTAGRWLSEDPVQDSHFQPLTLNFYAYTNLNPLVYTDPDGRIPLPVITGAIGVAAGLGVYALTHRGNMTVQGALAYAAAGGLVGVSPGIGGGALAARGAAMAPLAEIASRRGDPTRVLGRVRDRSGQIAAWLERGKAASGFEHIQRNHGKQFRGIWGELTEGDLIGIILDAAGKAGGVGARVVEVTFRGISHEVLVVIGENGYIVNAYPWSR